VIRGLSMTANGRTAIKTNLQTHMLASTSLQEDAMTRFKAFAATPGKEFPIEERKSLQQGCATTLVAAFDPDIENQNGQYLHNGNVATILVPTEDSMSLENQERLWKLSEELVGEKFNW
jgi:hypothetical protein